MALVRLTTSPVGVLVVMAIVALVATTFALRTWLRDRPSRRSSARERLLVRNPWLTECVDASRWSRASRRVQLGWLTSLVVSVAVLVASDRPVNGPVPTGDPIGNR